MLTTPVANLVLVRKVSGGFTHLASSGFALKGDFGTRLRAPG